MALQVPSHAEDLASQPVAVDPLLRMHVAPSDRGVTVLLAGELDLATCRGLRELIAPVAAEGGDVVLGLRDVTFLDSSAINLLVGMHHLCQTNGGRLVLEGPTGTALRALKICCVDLELTIT